MITANDILLLLEAEQMNMFDLGKLGTSSKKKLKPVSMATTTQPKPVSMATTTQPKHKEYHVSIPVKGKSFDNIDLLNEYNYLMKTLFKGELHTHPPILEWKRLKNVTGKVVYLRTVRMLGKRIIEEKYEIKELNISNQLRLPLTTLRSILAHEMVHLIQFQIEGKAYRNPELSHGRIFKQYVVKYNAAIKAQKLPIDEITVTDDTSHLREYNPTSSAKQKPKVFLHIENLDSGKDYIGNVYDAEKVLIGKDQTIYKSFLDFLIRLPRLFRFRVDITAYLTTDQEINRYPSKRSFNGVSLIPVSPVNLLKLIHNSEVIHALRGG